MGRLKTMTEGLLRETLSKHFPKTEFEIRTEPNGSGSLFFASPSELSNKMPTFITISNTFCCIELNFKRSSCSITKKDIERYAAFVMDTLEGQEKKKSSGIIES
jgi:hypothetical protein